MSVTVTERKVDDKRRVTLPPAVGLREGDTVVMIASKDAAIVASDRGVAEKLRDILRELETKRKVDALVEWEKLLGEAGLSDLDSRKIDAIVGKSIARPRDSGVGKERSNR